MVTTRAQLNRSCFSVCTPQVPLIILTAWILAFQHAGESVLAVVPTSEMVEEKTLVTAW